jgi:hypothetical protein
MYACTLCTATPQRWAMSRRSLELSSTVPDPNTRLAGKPENFNAA